ncbi:MAG: lipid-A-disaccharide synthase [Pseudomonadota bacterium]
MTIALAAGEASGDQLGAALAKALNQRCPDIQLTGVTGLAMQTAGVQSLASIEQLSVMGLTEVLRHLPHLVQFRRSLRRQLLESDSALFVGIDAPDFNLGLARQLRRRGMPTAQFVAPSVWAWRRYRISKIARSVDLLMTLFPFEAQHFVDSGLNVRYVGHPLADELPMEPDKAGARRQLALSAGQPLIALLPGSRSAEIKRHAGLMINTARELQQADASLQTMLLLAEPDHLELFRQAAGRDPAELGIALYCGQTRTGLSAADVAIAASGTVTLEALLCKTPMSVFYRLSPGSYWLAQRLVQTRWIALPNVLANDNLVPERLQQQAQAKTLAVDALCWLEQTHRAEVFRERAVQLHQQLACSAAQRAAAVLLETFGLALSRTR